MTSWVVALVPLALLVTVMLFASAGCTLDTQGLGPADPNAEIPEAPPYDTAITQTPGLVAYWRLGEDSGTTAEDGASHPDGPYPGVYQDVSQLELGQPGLIDGDPTTSVRFSGGYVEVDHSPALNPQTAFSVEAWVEAEEELGPDEIAVVVGSSVGSPNPPGYVLFRRREGNQPERWGAMVAGQGAVTLASGGEVGFGQFATTLLVATYDGTTLKLWENASTEPSDQVDTDIYQPNEPPAPLTIGAAKDGIDVSLPFMGRIQEVAIYDIALDQQTIVNHYFSNS